MNEESLRRVLESMRLQRDLCCDFLESLDIIQHNIQLSGITMLVPILAILPNLKHLQLQGNALGDAGTKSLCEQLPAIGLLSSLDLSHNNITDDGVVHICETLPNLPYLAQLWLDRNLITESGGARLIRATSNFLAGSMEEMFLGLDNGRLLGLPASFNYFFKRLIAFTRHFPLHFECALGDAARVREIMLSNYDVNLPEEVCET